MLRLTNTITPVRLVANNLVKAYTTGATQVPAKRPENEVLQADVVSSAPEELKLRTVRIFKPTRNVMQSGVNATRKWRLDFDILEGSARWENPLMGWASSSDSVQGLRMNFKTKDDAILFAEKQGWNYYVQEPKQTKFTKKLYANNYKHSYGPLRIAHTK